jgi:hypothetical protein
MQITRRRAKAVHSNSRESATAMPRIRAAGKIRAWRAGDGERACPIDAVPARTPAAAQQEDLPLAA